MKRHITYIAMLLTALTGASCSQDETPVGDGRTGVMAMTISTSRAADNGEYDPLQYQKVYIYNSEGGLLRQKPLLLCKQLCIGGVQLQEPLYIPQVFLHIKQLRIGLAKCLAEFCGVTVDLNGDAFDSACQNGTPP